MFLSSSFGEVPRSPQVIAYKGRPVYAATVSAVLVFPDPGGPADAIVSYLSSHLYSSSNMFSQPFAQLGESPEVEAAQENSLTQKSHLEFRGMFTGNTPP